MRIFVERLNELMTERGLSQKQVATAAETTQQAISRYLNDSRTPDIETLSKICKFFGVSADYLIGLENEDGTKNY